MNGKTKVVIEWGSSEKTDEVLLDDDFLAYLDQYAEANNRTSNEAFNDLLRKGALNTDAPCPFRILVAHGLFYCTAPPYHLLGSDNFPKMDAECKVCERRPIDRLRENR